MKRILRAGVIIGIGLLATACDRCGDWNANAPKICRSSNLKV